MIKIFCFLKHWIKVYKSWSTLVICLQSNSQIWWENYTQKTNQILRILKTDSTKLIPPTLKILISVTYFTWNLLISPKNLISPENLLVSPENLLVSPINFLFHLKIHLFHPYISYFTWKFTAEQHNWKQTVFLQMVRLLSTLSFSPEKHFTQMISHTNIYATSKPHIWYSALSTVLYVELHGTPHTIQITNVWKYYSVQLKDLWNTQQETLIC